MQPESGKVAKVVDRSGRNNSSSRELNVNRRPIVGHVCAVIDVTVVEEAFHQDAINAAIVASAPPPPFGCKAINESNGND